MQGRELGSLPALPAAGGGQIGWRSFAGKSWSPAMLFTSGSLEASASYFNGGETRDRRTGAEHGGNLQMVIRHPYPDGGDKRLVALCPPVPGKGWV